MCDDDDEECEFAAPAQPQWQKRDKLPAFANIKQIPAGIRGDVGMSVRSQFVKPSLENPDDEIQMVVALRNLFPKIEKFTELLEKARIPLAAHVETKRKITIGLMNLRRTGVRLAQKHLDAGAATKICEEIIRTDPDPIVLQQYRTAEEGLRIVEQTGPFQLDPREARETAMRDIIHNPFGERVLNKE